MLGGLLAAGLLAADAPADSSTTFMPLLFSISAGEGTSYAMKDGDESSALGGVEIGYENVRLTCDTLRYWQATIPGVRRPVVKRCLLVSGPKGADPAHVVFDSRTSQLPQVAFRGLMKPAQVEIQRQEPDPAAPGVVRFAIHLTGVGGFSGLLKDDKDWQPYAGWAETADIVVRADIDTANQELANQHFETIHLHGRPRTVNQAKERARLLRLKAPLPDGITALTLPEADCKAGTVSMTISLFFAADGSVERASTSSDSYQFGDELFGSRDVAPTSKPTLTPPKAP
jgi:hypothetical protein